MKGGSSDRGWKGQRPAESIWAPQADPGSWREARLVEEGESGQQWATRLGFVPGVWV